MGVLLARLMVCALLGLSAARCTAGPSGERADGTVDDTAADAQTRLDGTLGMCSVIQTERLPGTCIYSLPSAPGDMSSIEVSSAGRLGPRDTTHSKGWDYVDGSMTSIEIFGTVCAAIMDGSVTDTLILYTCTSL